MLTVVGPTADRLSTMMAALGVAAVGYAVLHLHPRLGICLWLSVVCFAPVWLGVTFHFYLIPQVVAGVLVVATLLPSTVFLGATDLLAATILVLALVPILVGGAFGPGIFALLSESLVGFLLGRLALGAVGANFLYKCIAVLFSVVAVLALGEFLLTWNPFVALSAGNSQFTAWGTLQERGGIIRAEGAFGHSIALGASLAMAIPFTLAARWPFSIRVLMVIAMLAGAVVSFSRTGMACAALGLVLSILFMTDLSRRLKALVVAVAVTVFALVVPMVTAVFVTAGSEATNSANYRDRLLGLVPQMAPLGLSSAAFRQADGDLRFGDFRSIDNALVLFGLMFGWMSLAVIAGLLVTAVVAVLVRKSTPARIAIVAQIPAFVTVALITQYSMLVWFVAGVAVTTQVAHQRQTASSAKRSVLPPVAPVHGTTLSSQNSSLEPAQ